MAWAVIDQGAQFVFRGRRQNHHVTPDGVHQEKASSMIWQICGRRHVHFLNFGV